MRTAVIEDEGLCAPTVGTWRPLVGQGRVLAPATVLGEIICAGRRVPVIAPVEVSGVVTDVVGSGTWVEFGSRLVGVGTGVQAEHVVVFDDPVQAEGATSVPDGVTVVRSDTDGTVYLRSEPGQPVFAAPDSVVSVRQTLALVEVMKTFSPVRSPIAGVVSRICVTDGQGIEAGAALFWLGTETTDPRG